MKKTISGIRGIFGKDLSLRDVLEFCNNFSSLIKSNKCVIGMDTRLSGQMIKETACAALMKNGIDVFDLETVPTPIVFREARRYGAGLVISASHNPLEWNGLKFIIEGRGINEQELAQITEHQHTESGVGRVSGLSTAYIDDAKEIIGNIKASPEIIVDVGGGAAGGFAPRLLTETGCKVKVLNECLAGCTRGPDPTTDSLSELVASTRDKTGFAFDLDGDRLVVVRDQKKQSPDVTLGLGVAKSLEMGYRNFVLSIDSSISVERFIKERGGTVSRSKVGEANVIELLLKNNAQAGGEGSSGGFILPEFNYCRDGILTSGLIASMLGTPEFEEVVSYMEGYSQIRERVGVDSSLHSMVIDEVHSKFSRDCSEIVTLDGVKGIIDENSWVLIRKSNTEHVIRISAESNDGQRCKEIIRDAHKLVRDSYERVR